MNVRSILEDNRIQALNVLVELTVKDYLLFAKDIIDTNDFQRKRVIKSKIKEILTEDLLRGCVIPSIVLAISNKEVSTIKDTADWDTAKSIISNAIETRNLVIIDGLQRTYVLKGLEDELRRKNDQGALERLHALTIRAEVYLGLSRTGLLYRMITLNTGQTTMSTRHLMEILYLDYSRLGIDGITLLKDKDDTAVAEDTNTFNFKIVLDGFNSYIEKDESVTERVDMLNNVKSLEVLKKEEEAQEDQEEKDRDLFKEFLLTHKAFLDTLVQKSNNWRYDADDVLLEYRISSHPFGKSVLDIFKKSQAVTGFGAALGFLKEKKVNLEGAQMSFEEIYTSADWDATFWEILKHFDMIKERSKKIGNDQRYYFKYFFRGLLNPNSDSAYNIMESAGYAYKTLHDEKGYKA